MRGILLLAHGARDPRWAEPFESIAQQMRMAAPHCRVALAYLELMTPTLDAAGAALLAEGCDQLTVVPMFLGAGSHVRRDLPERIASLRAAHPRVPIDATCAIGESDDLIRALAEQSLKLALSGPDTGRPRPDRAP